MKRNDLILAFFCIVTFSIILGITSTKAAVTPDGKGTLMSNGTIYCCASGSRTCGAAPCN